jgi:hypothetical protein
MYRRIPSLPEDLDSTQEARSPVAGFILTVLVFVIGVCLEVVRLTNHKDSSPDSDKGTACFIASQLMGPRDFSVHLFSIMSMALAIVSVVLDIVQSQCFLFRKRFAVSEYDGIDELRDQTLITTCRIPRSVTFWSIVTFGTLPITQAIIQCIAVFIVDDCWTATGRGYHVIRSLFMALIVVYFGLLMKRNVALFSRNYYNNLMTYFVVCTALYVVLRNVFETQSFLHHFDDLSSRRSNTSVNLCTCHISTDASWLIESYANSNFQLLSSTVSASILMFISYYVDVWITHRKGPKPSDLGTTKYIARSEVVSDRIALATAFVVSMTIAGCIVLGYTDLIKISYLPYFQLVYLAVALIIAFAAIIGLVIIQPNLKIHRKVCPIEIFILMTLIGASCGKIVNVFIFSVTLYSSSTIRPESAVGILEQLALLAQSVLQTVLLLISLRRAGRFANGCWGRAKVSNVAYVLAVLNWGKSNTNVTYLFNCQNDSLHSANMP